MGSTRGKSVSVEDSTSDFVVDLRLEAESSCVKALQTLIQTSLKVGTTYQSFFEIQGNTNNIGEATSSKITATAGPSTRFLWQETLQSIVESLIVSENLKIETREKLLSVGGEILVAMASYQKTPVGMNIG